MCESLENWVRKEMENIERSQNLKYQMVRSRRMYSKACTNAAEETEKLIVRYNNGIEEKRENYTHKENTRLRKSICTQAVRSRGILQFLFFFKGLCLLL